MNTKYILTIGGDEHDATLDLSNWEDIICEILRSGFRGATRSISNSFSFAGETCERLFDLFKESGYNASARLAMFAMNDCWGWDKVFESDLDFTTARWDGRVLEINCIDRSLASLLWANKSVKYEFEVGADIHPDTRLSYDRIVMANTVTHGIVGDGTADNGDTILEEAADFRRLPTYVLNDEEVYDGSPICFKDQDAEPGDFMLRVERSVEQVRIDVEIEADAYDRIEVRMYEFDASSQELDGTYRSLGTLFSYGAESAMERHCLGFFASVDELMAQHPVPPSDCWAAIGVQSDRDKPCEPTGRPYYCAVDFDGNRYWAEGTIARYQVFDDPEWHWEYYCLTKKSSQRITISSPAVGKRYALYYRTHIPSSASNRQSIQRISSKIASMWKGRGNPIDIDAIAPSNVLQRLVRRISGDAGTWVRISPHDPRLAKTFIVAGESIRGLAGAKLSTTFNDFCNWMEAVFGYTYKFEEDGEGNAGIAFVHRSELFDPQASAFPLRQTSDLRCSMSDKLIFTSVEVGYPSQNYEAACGRDEWNFSAEYTTGCSLTEKKLSLKSPYRADCYGFEFISQKRNGDTTDDRGDSSVFFVYCDEVADQAEGEPSLSTHLVVNRDAAITGALSHTVFNGAYSPYYCVKANEGYITAMSDRMTLAFASCDGNRGISVDGHGMGDDIPLQGQLFTSVRAVFEAECEDVLPEDLESRLVEFENGGVKYSGYIAAVQTRWARTSPRQFEIILKSFERI